MNINFLINLISALIYLNNCYAENRTLPFKLNKNKNSLNINLNPVNDNLKETNLQLISPILRIKREPPSFRVIKHRSRYIKQRQKPRRRVKSQKIPKTKYGPPNYNFGEPLTYYEPHVYNVYETTKANSQKNFDNDFQEFEKNFGSNFNLDTFSGPSSADNNKPISFDFYDSFGGGNKDTAFNTEPEVPAYWENLTENPKSSYDTEQTYQFQTDYPQKKTKSKRPKQNFDDRPSGEIYQTPEFTLTSQEEDSYQVPIEYQKPANIEYEPILKYNFKTESNNQNNDEPQSSYLRPDQSNNKYLPPEQPSNKYLPPEQPSDKYLPPEQPSNQYLPPEQPSNKYFPVELPNNKYVPAERPSNKYLPSERPKSKYTPPERPPQNYGQPERPNHTFRPAERPAQKYVPAEIPIQSYRPTETYGAPERQTEQYETTLNDNQEQYPNTDDYSNNPPDSPSISQNENNLYDRKNGQFAEPPESEVEVTHATTIKVNPVTFSDDYQPQFSGPKYLPPLIRSSDGKAKQIPENTPGPYAEPPPINQGPNYYSSYNPPNHSNLPLNDGKRPSYDFPKTSYEVPIYSSPPIIQNENNHHEYYPPINGGLFNDQETTITKGSNNVEISVPSGQFENQQAINFHTLSASLEELDEPPTSFLDNILGSTSTTTARTRKRKRIKSTASKQHNLDSDELRKAFGSTSQLGNSNLREKRRPPNIPNYLLAASATNKSPTSDDGSSQNWEPVKVRNNLDLSNLNITKPAIRIQRTSEKKFQDIEVISIEKSLSRSFYDGTMSPIEMNQQYPGLNLHNDGKIKETIINPKNSNKSNYNYRNNDEIPKNHKFN